LSGVQQAIPLHPEFSGRSKKSQDCVRFTRKIGARVAKSSKLAPSSLKQGRFYSPLSLIFWLTEQGRHIGKPLVIKT